MYNMSDREPAPGELIELVGDYTIAGYFREVIGDLCYLQTKKSIFMLCSYDYSLKKDEYIWRYPERFKKDYELELVPGKPCLVRDLNSEKWKAEIFMSYNEYRPSYYYKHICLKCRYKFAIPYDNNLVGKI